MDVPSTSAPEDEDAIVAALQRALGATESSHECATFVRALGADACSDRKSFGATTEYVNYRSSGASLCFEGGRLSTVHVYGRTNRDGFRAWAHGLPVVTRGLSMTSTARDIVEVLGEPTTKGGMGRMIWLSYDHMGLKFDVAASNWDAPDAELVSVAIWDAVGD